MADDIPHPDGLAPDERLLAEWRPSARVFWRKFVFWGVVSALIFFAGAAGFGVPLPVFLIGFPLCVVAFMFVFGDYQDWLLRRNDRWLLTDRRLIFRNAAGEHGSVDLNRIEQSRVGLWALTLRLTDRQAVTMPYLPDRTEVRDCILETRDRMKGTAHGG